MGSIATSTSQDNRVQVGSTGAGQFVSPGANVANPGSILATAGSGAELKISAPTSISLQGKFRMGMDGAEVANLLTQTNTINAEILREQVGGAQRLSELAFGALSTQTTGVPADLTKFIPIALIAVVAIAWVRRR